MSLSSGDSHRRLRVWIALCGVLACGFSFSLWWVTINRHGRGEAPGNLASLWVYWVTFGVSWFGLTAWVCGWRVRPPRHDHNDGRRRQAVWVLSVALLARLIAWASGPPQLSDDLWRYIHDGRQLADGLNPYARSPAQLGAGQGADPILDQINHPELVTIYQPTSLYVFSGLWWLHPRGWDPTGHWTFRLGFILIDLVVVALILYQLTVIGRSAWWAVLYAWHPLAVSEVAQSGHQDVIGIACMLGALSLAEDRRGSVGRACGVGGLFAAAVAVKPIILPLALPLAWRGRDRALMLFVTGATTAITLTCLYLPFVLAGGGIAGLFDTARTFVGQWSFNSSLHAAAMWIVGSKPVADSMMAIGLGATLITVTIAQRDVWRAASLYLLAGVLLSSTAHPWYLLWALALVPMRFNPAIWGLSFTLSWSYLVLGDIARWHLPLWVVVAEYGPVYAAVIYELVGWLRRRRLPRLDISNPSTVN